VDVDDLNQLIKKDETIIHTMKRILNIMGNRKNTKMTLEEFQKMKEKKISEGTWKNKEKEP
jgi:hypothetical protein